MDLPVNIFDEDDFNVGLLIHPALDLAEPVYNENIVERNNVVRNENYFELTILSYTDIQFKDHFRMSRQTFQVRAKILYHNLL